MGSVVEDHCRKELRSCNSAATVGTWGCKPNYIYTFSVNWKHCLEPSTLIFLFWSLGTKFSENKLAFRERAVPSLMCLWENMLSLQLMTLWPFIELTYNSSWDLQLSVPDCPYLTITKWKLTLWPLMQECFERCVQREKKTILRRYWFKDKIEN